MNIARSIIKVGISRVGKSLIVFLGITWFARQLSPAEMGIFFLFQASLGILSLVADFGVGDAVEKRISEGGNRDDIFATGLFLKSALVLSICAIIVVIRGPINTYLGADLALFLVLGLMIQEFARLGSHTLNGELRVSETATLQFVQQAVWIGLGVALVVFGWKSDGLVYAFLAGMLVFGLLSVYRIQTSFGSPTTDLARSLFDFSKYSFVTSSGGLVYSWMDILVIGFFLSQTQVGQYEMAWRVVMAVTVFNRAITMTIYPQLSEWDAQDSVEKIERLVKNMFLPSIILSLPALFGGLLFAREILVYLFGSEYGAASLVLTVLLFSAFIQSVQTAYGRVLPGMDRPDLDAKSALMTLTINMVLNIVFVWQFGILGAAVATTIAKVCSAVIELYFVRQLVTVSFRPREVAWCVVSSVAMTVALVYVESIVSITSVFRLLVVIGLGAAIYAIVLLSNRNIRNRVATVL
ncbi:flippase [Salinigranum sp. GCM10025319]|uniref:flippase n=1 Tax=Salinigranum sp. GCM10025319 TaxID=3252687 RepID=UPI003609F942